MKGNSKGRLRSSKLHVFYHKSFSANAVMAAAAFCFVLGWLRSSFMTSAPATPTPVKSDDPVVLNSGVGVSAPERREMRTMTLPVLEPYAHGVSGEPEPEHIQFQLLTWKPRAFIFPGFVDAERCDKIVKVANESMHPSGLALREGEKEEDQKNVRTSTGTFLMGSQDPSGALAWVERKMARITGVPVEQGEAFNILRYVRGQQYQAHMDTFDPKEFGPQSSNRVASFLLYLTDVEEGGETNFPREGGVVRTKRFDECVGLKVKPKKGDALLFWSMTPERTIDPNSLHASCAIVKGEKWVATKWVRDKA